MPDVSVLTAHLACHESHSPTPVSVVVERQGHRTVIVLDDGTTIDFNADELSAAACPVASDQPFWAGLRRAA